MANIGELIADIGVDTSGLRQDMTKAKRIFSTGVKRMNSVLSSVRRTIFSIRGALLGLGVGLVARSFIQAASTVENLGVRLRVLLGSVDEGNRLLADMTKFASGVAFEFEEIIGAATDLAAVVGNVDEVNKFIPIVADLAAVTGLSVRETTGQIIRMYSAGAASADLFRERGVLAMLGFQAGVSVSAEETRKRLLEAFEDIDSKFRGAAKGLSSTWDGLISMLLDRWFQFRVKVAESASFDFIKSGLDLLVTFIDEKGNEMDTFAEKVGKGIVDIMKRSLIGAAATADAIIPVISGIFSAVSEFWNTFRGLPAWVQEIGIAGAFIGGKKGLFVIAGLTRLISAASTSVEGFSAALAGHITFAELATANHNELKKKLQELKDKGIIPAKEELEALGGVNIKTGDIQAQVEKIIKLIEERMKTLGDKGIKNPLVPDGEDVVVAKSIFDRLTKAERQALQQTGFFVSEFEQLKRAEINKTADMLETALTKGVQSQFIAAAKLAEIDEFRNNKLRGLELARVEFFEQLRQKELESIIAHSESFGEVATASIEKWTMQVQTFAQVTGEIITSVFDKVSEGIGDSVADAIVEGQSLVEGLKALAADTLKFIISTLVKIGIQKLITSALVKLLDLSIHTSKMAELSAQTYAIAFAQALPFGGPGAAATYAGVVTGEMLAGSSAAAGIGAGVAGAQGQLDEGIDFVPKRGTFMLDKGEAVLDERLNADLKEFLRGGGRNKNMNITLELDGYTLARVMAPHQDEAKGDKVNFG